MTQHNQPPRVTGARFVRNLTPRSRPTQLPGIVPPRDEQDETPAVSYFSNQEYAGDPSPTDGTITLGTDMWTRHPLTLTQEQLQSGLYCLGVQGTGKSSLLNQLIQQQMELGDSVFVLDPHGDLIYDVIARMPAHRVKDTYLLDIKQGKYPFGLNLFACANPNNLSERDAVRNRIMNAFGKIWPEVKEGQYFEKLLRHVVATMIENPQLTMAHIPDLLEDEKFRMRYTKHIKNTETKRFWLRLSR